MISIVCAIILLQNGARAATPLVSPPPVFNWYIPLVTYGDPYIKKGVNLRNGECALIELVHARWYHDWGNDWCPVPQNVLYADMLFSYPDPPSGWNITSEYVMGFNEPNLLWQSNVPPIIGAAGWRWLETSYPNHILISPAFSQPHPSNTCSENRDNCGIQWMREMISSYEYLYGERPRFDKIAVHWYGETLERMQKYLTRIRQELVDMGYDKPIWITEFGSCPTSWRNEFLEQAMTWMDSTPWIEKYAWYSSRVPPVECDVNLLNEDGTLTSIGIIYRDHGTTR